MRLQIFHIVFLLAGLQIQAQKNMDLLGYLPINTKV
ncbi:MAG: hypothetical protein ACI8V8_001571, partial [Chitinophagales bacterium]